MKYKSRIFKEFEFSQIFFRFLLIDRLMIKKDNLVLITGKRGDGKTTLALKLIFGLANMEKMGKYYNEQVNINVKEKKKHSLEGLKSFDFSRDMAFTRKDLQDLCKNTRNGFILADEAIVNAARRNSMTKANKILMEVLTINRKNANTIFFCLPSIEDFDISILQYVTHWIHIDDRGLGCVLLPGGKTPFGRKTWDIDRMKKVYDKFLEDNPGVNMVPYWLFDNFRGYIRFKALGSKIEERYLEIAHTKKNADSDEEEKKVSNIDRYALPDDKKKIITEIAKEIMSGKMIDKADMDSKCGGLELTKDKLGREVNKVLIANGEGRPAFRIIKENKKKDDASYEKQINSQRIIY